MGCEERKRWSAEKRLPRINDLCYDGRAENQYLMLEELLMKRLLVLLAVWLMLVQTAAAQTVTVDGYGVDENAARRDAARQAVEQVAGTYIASKTLVENYVTQLDEIYAQAQGFVTGMEVMSSGQEG